MVDANNNNISLNCIQLNVTKNGGNKRRYIVLKIQQVREHFNRIF